MEVTTPEKFYICHVSASSPLDKDEPVGFYNAVMHPKDIDEMANNVDTDQTAPLSNLIWVCTVCLNLSVPIHKNFTVLQY